MPSYTLRACQNTDVKGFLNSNMHFSTPHGRELTGLLAYGIRSPQALAGALMYFHHHVAHPPRPSFIVRFLRCQRLAMTKPMDEPAFPYQRDH